MFLTSFKGTGLELGCNLAHSGLRIKFTQQMQQLSLKGVEGNKHRSPTATVLSDDKAGFQVLASRFSAFLAGVAIACNYNNALLKNIPILEAETRRPWDIILDLASSHEDGHLNTNLLYVKSQC